MKVILSEKKKIKRDQVLDLVTNFDIEGVTLFDGKRNEIKVFGTGNKKINIKAFKVPNLVNIVAYSFFRKSKAERSFTYAGILLSKNILTPAPLAYVEERKNLLISRSYYISEHLDYDFTFREVNLEKDFPEREELLRAFTRFTFNLHENNVNFLDHSPGNTLIKKNGGNPQFYLIDLNRMKFHKMDFDQRMKNFSRLTTDEEVIRIMSDEYARLITRKREEVFERMLFYTTQFQEKRNRKKALKRKMKSLIGE